MLYQLSYSPVIGNVKFHNPHVVQNSLPADS